MKFRLGFLFTALLGTLLFAASATAQVTQSVVSSKPVAVPFSGPMPANILVWDSENKAIDAHDGDAQGHLSFAFTNVSAADVVISNVHPGCGCTTAQLPALPWTIPAGSNGQFGVTINLHGKVGTIFKTLTVTTDKGLKVLNFRVNILPVPLPVLTPAARTNMLKVALADRQSVFKGDCALCHVKQGDGKYYKELYDADCGICHEGEHRLSMVTDLHSLKVPTNEEFWRTWIAHGKPGTLMPAFAVSEGGPLSDYQIATLAKYLTSAFPSKSTP